MNPGTNLLRTKEELARLNGQEVIALGRYCAIPRPVKGMVRPDVPRDRALLRLDDGTDIFLEPLDSPESQRPSDELERWDGKRVRICGVAHVQMPSRGQSLIAPCLSGVTEIRETE